MLVFAILFTELFHIHGAILPNFALFWLCSSRFQAGVFLAASGAVMDLANVAASMQELVDKRISHNDRSPWVALAWCWLLQSI